MPPADDATPDFDSMSPEELMAWMETLAERQGASEGFTTEKRMDIAEVDPDSVADTGPGYIPYGMSEEDWATKQAKEQADREARQVTAPSTPAPSQPEPVAEVPPEPIPSPVASSEPTDAAPDFDSMSPEELMAWMETLAERQGASEGFTTEKRMDIAEVDPDSVADTGPGYIPYGMSEEDWATKQAKEQADREARQAQKPAVPAQPGIQDAVTERVTPDLELPTLDLDFENSTEPTEGLDWLESLAADQNEAIASIDLSGLGDGIEALDLDALGGLDNAQPEVVDPEQWLGDLAGADDDSGFALPTSDPTEATPQQVAEPTDADPMEWLESLARGQGADPEEFTTAASLDVDEEADLEPANLDFLNALSADDIGELDDIDQLDAVDMSNQDDPVAWLDNLASSQSLPDSTTTPASYPVEIPKATEDTPPGFKDDPLVQETLTEGGIVDQLNKGKDVSSDDMRSWMDNLLSQGVERSDSQGFQIPQSDDEDLEEPEANIPDWLVEQVGPPPDLSGSAPVQEQKPVFDESINAPQADVEVDIPDWLQANAEEGDSMDLSDIFASASEPIPEPANQIDPRTVTDQLAIDSNDPWVEAFELEGSEHLEEWYEDSLEKTKQGDVSVKASAQTSVDLQPAQFEVESSLNEGELQAVPNWLSDVASEQPDVVAQTAVPASEPETASMPFDLGLDDDSEVTDMPDWLTEMEDSQSVEVDETVAEVDTNLPDWLKEAGVETDTAVPDWLKDTITSEEPQVSPQESFLSEPITSPVPVPAPPAPVVAQPTRSPAPMIVPATMDEATATQMLNEARTKISENDVDGGLHNYEAIVHANAQLDVVVNDLSTLIKDKNHKENAGIHRVLGDGLMRVGRLQEALTMYRKALNLL